LLKFANEQYEILTNFFLEFGKRKCHVISKTTAASNRIVFGLRRSHNVTTDGQTDRQTNA